MSIRAVWGVFLEFAPVPTCPRGGVLDSVYPLPLRAGGGPAGGAPFSLLTLPLGLGGHIMEKFLLREILWAVSSPFSLFVRGVGVPLIQFGGGGVDSYVFPFSLPYKPRLLHSL